MFHQGVGQLWLIKPCQHGLGGHVQSCQGTRTEQFPYRDEPVTEKKIYKGHKQVSRVRCVVQWEELWAGRQESVVCCPRLRD